MLLKSLKTALPFLSPKPLKHIAVESGLGGDYFQNGELASWPNVETFIKICKTIDVDCGGAIDYMCGVETTERLPTYNADLTIERFRSNVSNAIYNSGLKPIVISKLSGISTRTIERARSGKTCKLFIIDCVCDAMNVKLVTMFNCN